MSNKIAIFYHVYQFGDWQKLFEHQIVKLQKSGLYDTFDYLHIGVNGSWRMPGDLSKANFIVRNKNIGSQEDTLKSLYDFCINNQDYKVLYIHTKDVTKENTTVLLNYLEYFNIDRWRDCVGYLDNHDCVGSNWEKDHYSGNFWWANASYISKLDPNKICDQNWISSQKPIHYDFTADNSMFKETIEKKCRIGMISMFKNEAKNIGKMLDSLNGHIDYWVLQNNGSTDGTPEVVEEWAARTKIPGYMYNVKEGWVGFGWNRDHVLQTYLKSPHNCDWILKMDCDETLEIDDDFDWKILNDNKNVVSWNVQSEAPGTVYLRTWLWNAHLPWKFNHDPAHETIYLDDGKNNTEFERITLPGSFRLMAGASYGESYTVPTKYISDALKLEEKLIREGNLLTNLYHFWYLGKSYSDCYGSSALLLGKSQQKEYARRCIYYLTEYLNHTHDFQNTGKAKHIDEMSYVGLCCIGHAYRFLEQYDESEKAYKNADSFSPGRNEHLVHLAELHLYKMEYHKALEYATILMSPDRKCPFPNYCFLINTQCYNDKGNYCRDLYNVSLEWSEKTK
jgi:glycosyltransferase involved in cell wall biosynthesis